MLALFALATALSASQTSDGDAIVAAAWERRRQELADPVDKCVERGATTMADDIRRPDGWLDRIIAKDDADARPSPALLRRIAKGEGRTLDFDVKRLGLPAPSPACKYHYSVSAPVVLDGYGYVHVGMTCPGLCGHGEVLLLERREGAWRVVEQLVEWWS